MELKPYQQQVLNDVDTYFEYLEKTNDIADSFNQFWQDKYGEEILFQANGIEAYKNTITNVPHLCVKVPTAGGKTFIAANALHVIFSHYDIDKPKAVVWLVPSITILEQTIRNLSDVKHPYRQKLNAHFGSKVEVYKKEDLLQGAGFDPISVKDQLNIFVLSFDSLRTKNKEGRKFYQENGALASFAQLLLDKDNILEGTDETALINVIRQLNPVVVVDESHNAESALSVEMLKNLNPSFIFDLTATPRKNSNIISYVDALALKKENMVKLPVIVYNHKSRTEVIESAINLQRKLEADAKAEEAEGGRYIRPIVLFQAQPKTNDDNTTFEKIKKLLLELQIPEAQIKIKTANINEIKGIDLMSRDCEVRYIITVDALKEGWDCPFAYILASLADKSSAVSVEQILGRILRQPHVMRHKYPLLNMSFVLTASAKFLETLDNIVAGLNRAGFSAKDYKVADNEQEITDAPEQAKGQPLELLLMQSRQDTPHTGAKDEEQDIEIEVDTKSIHLVSPETIKPNANKIDDTIDIITAQAVTADREMESQVQQAVENPTESIPSILKDIVKTYPIKEIFREDANGLILPQFTVKAPLSGIFGDVESITFHKDMLLKNFKLSQADSMIDFDNLDSEIYQVDVVATGKENSRAEFRKVAASFKEPLMEYIVAQPKDVQRERLTARMMQLIGNMYPISDAEVKGYLRRVFDSFDAERSTDMLRNELSYRDKIREKVRLLTEEYAEKQFQNQLDTDKIGLNQHFKLKPQISPSQLAPAITKSLYEREGHMNDFEQRVINEVANLENIAFWHRNIEKKGFYLNGFINHYPDFIVLTKSGKMVVIETKGDHLDNDDSRKKLSLGQAWANKAGDRYKYFMVFNTNPIAGARSQDDFLKILREM
ncbi:DEAD/DEAH box helicase family protein [Pontibacter sp. FD36]|uniref:DEAD/DEAH box helicase n=1 Tax=Pontibacter sp. FD36 TaxID=2789860 RepID=UPI0018AAF5AF|nr:DEAD/DEAH box helicase family protein [Pontibacter sp. FD36]MBF8963006.1 DEAD/DEAH box helicase family protein [Pontibacter sp. FD36]